MKPDERTDDGTPTTTATGVPDREPLPGDGPSRRGRRRMARSPALPTGPDAWRAPTLSVGLKTKIGSSVVEEFVAAHGPADVLREIVQNEFDGGGTELSIAFGHDGLTIVGSGRPIGRKGWKRLDVIMGTGQVLGGDAGAVVEAKQNGIGSKNFGLRSLFLFGDRIFVHSNGRVAILDCVAMATGHQADPASVGGDGVIVHVPYRRERRGTFDAFTVDREARTVDEISRSLLPTLLKLAPGGRRKGIALVEVTSVRTRRRLLWRQSAKLAPCALEGVVAVRRTGRFTVEGEGQAAHTTTLVDEVEYSRVAALPPEFAASTFPDYFRSPKGVRVCVSLPLRRNRIAVGAPGHFHYPLRATQGRTGCTASVSAPFRLDPDRTQLLDDDWNRWLVARAADLVGDLVPTEWLERFGADAYAALAEAGTAEPLHFRAHVDKFLGERACWPTRSREPGEAFARASHLAVPSHPLLDGFLGAGRQPASALARHPGALALAVKHGARAFSLNSLIRLCCAPADARGLATKLKEGEVDCHWRDYPRQTANPGRQVAAARAFTKLRDGLSNENRRDLRERPSTLTAAGGLDAASRLTLVDSSIRDVCPIPLNRRLHPALNGMAAVARICMTFDAGRWMADAAERAAKGTIDAAEREALYARLLAGDVRLPAGIVATLRRSPIVRDASGAWTAPEGLAILPKADLAVLAPVVSVPALELARRPELLRRLGVRRGPVPEDILRLAALAACDVSVADGLERLISRHPALLTRKVVEGLRQVPFLRSRAGGRRTPPELHLPTPANLACLADADVAAAGDPALRRTLGCREHPASTALLARLARARDSGTPVEAAEHVYPALVEALRRERVPIADLAGQAILAVGDRFAAPRDCLVLTHPVRCLQGALPILVGTSALTEAYRALGAATAPRNHHWIAMFERFDRIARSDRLGRLSPQDALLLRDAYRRRAGQGSLPEGLPTATRSLLALDNTLHSLDDVRAGRFLQNDHPRLANALADAGAGLAFADTAENSRAFFHGIGLRRLTEVCGVPITRFGRPCAPPPWFRRSHERDLLALLHSDAFATALTELAHAHRGNSAGFRPARRSTVRQHLRAVERVRFVADIGLTYRVARRTATVPSEAALLDGEVALVPPRNLLAFEHVVAATLAEVAGASRLADVRALSASIGTLLRCRTRDDMDAFLLRQGIEASVRLGPDLDLDVPEDPEDADPSASAIIRNLVAGLHIGGPVVNGAEHPPTRPTGASAAEPPASHPADGDAAPPHPFSLPPLGDVALRVAPPGDASPSAAGTGGAFGGRSRSTWTVPSSADVERDRQVGRRGEELVYRSELERVRGLGYARPDEHVTWTSRDDPGADHDIRSVAEDGGTLFIEVKSTAGTDGRFEWSRREFERAMREGGRYQLWRVYEAHTASPTAKAFPDLAALLQAGTLRIELASLRASVESKG